MVRERKAINARDGRNNSVSRGTARIDTAMKILRNGWIDGIVRDRKLTDDYKRDMANNFGANKDVTADYLLEQLEELSKPKRVWVDEMKDGRQILIFYWSNKEYTAEIDTSEVRFTFDK